MGRLLKALLKLLKGKVKIHIGSPGGAGVDINLSRRMSLVSAESVDYDVLIGLWKAVKAALFTLLAFLLATGGLDKFFETLGSNISSVGLPVWAVPVILAALKLLQNLIKQSLKSVPNKEPEPTEPPK